MFRLIVLACALSVSLASAQSKPAAAKDSALPKGAVELKQGVYKVTDAQGKTWIYRKSPFGYHKLSEEADAEAQARAETASKTSGNPFATDRQAEWQQTQQAAQQTSTAVETKAFEEGDSIRFERVNPFGVARWRKKKTELTKDEQEAWDRTRAKTTNAPPARGN